MFLDFCWNCQMNEQKFGCSSCKFARYCSEICQKEHWKLLHGSHCKYLSGKKVLRGSKHNPETCEICKKKSMKKDPSGMPCFIRMCDSDLEKFKRQFISITKYSFDLDKAWENRKTWNHVNLPFEFGEISGKYLNFLDKLLSFLQTLLCHLNSRYPQNWKLSQLLDSFVKIRAFHWSVSLIHGVTSVRIENTTEFIQRLMDTPGVLQLNKTLGNVESQDGVTAWNSFMFLYEMLGIYSLALIFSSVDVNSFNEEDRRLARNCQEWQVNIKNKEYSLSSDSFINQMKLMSECFESLTIFDDGFELKPFRYIYAQFSQNSDQSEQMEHYSCEVCQKNVDSRNCKYVYHSYNLFLEPSFDKPEIQNQKELENMVKCFLQIEEGKAYIAYTMGYGLKVICNEGDCKDIYIQHVFSYRRKIVHVFSLLISKYRTKFCYLQCWVCKIHSGESHRCKTCKSRLYCSKECQTQDWKIHEMICNKLKEAGTQVKSESQERKELGETRVENAYQSSLNGHHHCDEEDCKIVHQTKKLFGKLKLETNSHAEVD